MTEHWANDEKQRALFWSVVEGLDWSAVEAKGADSDKVHQFLGVENLRHFPMGIAEALDMVKNALSKQAKAMPPPTAAKPADLRLAEYGTREDVAALARRIRSMMPGGDQLAPEQAMAAAQYAILLDANPFRGEIYAFPDSRKKLVLVDGYKLLVRWAKRQAPYSERYDQIDDLPKGDIGYRCYILRNDALPVLNALLNGGADYKEAFEIAATSAVGILRKADTWSSKYNKEIDPPKSWTWHQVARKRALKNALNLSHGAPSPREIARASWMVGETETRPSDWQECTSDMSSSERARLAALTAQYRTREPDDREPDVILAEGRTLLHGEEEGLI